MKSEEALMKEKEHLLWKEMGHCVKIKGGVIRDEKSTYLEEKGGTCQNKTSIFQN